ncbi:MAG: glycosyltransferase family 2 protein [Alphaproteobacteria bacterium]|nr:glycosyltransferase family 2 protein [Alphaproteobacteria bacterium]
MKISAVIVAHNEEKKISDCLCSLDFADEIVVVLDKCTDLTKQIVLGFTDKIIEGSWNIEGARRNVALNAATCEWILEIDADERISPELRDEILAKIKSKPCGFSAPIANYIGKRWVKYGWLRILGVLERNTLSYRGLKHYDEDKEIHPTYSFNGEIRKLENPIMHLVDDNITDLLNRFNRYTTWRAKDIKVSKSFWSLVFGFKIRFLKSFVGKKGYKEGLLGVLLAVLCGLYPIVAELKSHENR